MASRRRDGSRKAGARAAASDLLRWRLWGLALLLAVPFGGAEALAQLSPHCERNGRREFCAVTFEENAPLRRESGGLEPPGDASGNGKVAAADTPEAESLTLWVVFADHSKVKLILAQHTCGESGPVRRCQAAIQTVPGDDRLSPAQYKGTAYEGGYRHEYSMPGLQIVFSYLD